MLRSKTLRLGLLLILATVFTIPGCDTLITEVNNITVFDSTIGQTCLAGCHSDNNNQITVPKGQWENSAHASPEFIEAHVTLNGTEFITNDADCGAVCHTSEGFIDFAKNGTSGTQATPSPIGCYTCHMPHTGNYGTWRLDSLRGEAELVILEGGKAFQMGKSNMCVQCHHAFDAAPTATEAITLSGKWGPHFSPQAEVVSGVGGFRFGTEVNDTITHTGITGKDGCIGCHYGSDGGIGAGYYFGEHTFRLEDSLGTQFNETCNITGCHLNDPIIDFYDFATIRETDSLASVIKDSLWGRHILDTSDPSGLSFYSDSTLKAYNIPILYNYLLFALDGSRGVHNPALMHSLMTATAARLDTIPPEANFELVNPSDTLICDGSVVSFLNTSLSNSDDFLWDPMDGNAPFAGLNYNHIYNIPGTYSIRLIASGPGEHVDTIIKEDIIVVEGTPSAAFAADEVTSCSSYTAIFSDQSVYASSWAWDFGDGGTDSVQNPSHDFSDTISSYTVTLAIEGFCGVDTLVMTDFINIRDAADEAIASFTMSADTITWGSSVTFTNTSPTADVWYWDFGDGSFDSSSTTSSFSPSHVYDSTSIAVDTFEISLTVKYGCDDSTMVDTIVVNPNE